jgi:hypothetical protein
VLQGDARAVTEPIHLRFDRGTLRLDGLAAENLPTVGGGLQGPERAVVFGQTSSWSSIPSVFARSTIEAYR